MPREAKKTCKKEKKAYRREHAKEEVCSERQKSMRKRKRAYQREQAREKVCPGKRNWQEKRCASQLREQIDKNFYHYIIKKDTRLKDHTICA